MLLYPSTGMQIWYFMAVQGCRWGTVSQYSGTDMVLYGSTGIQMWYFITVQGYRCGTLSQYRDTDVVLYHSTGIQMWYYITVQGYTCGTFMGVWWYSCGTLPQYSDIAGASWRCSDTDVVCLCSTGIQMCYFIAVEQYRCKMFTRSPAAWRWTALLRSP